MASSPPASPLHMRDRPLSAVVRPGPRSASRLSMSSKAGVASRASDDESRTAVKVAVRVRPPLKPDDPGYDLIPQRFQRSMVHTTSDTSLAIDSPQGRKIFVFDRVFSPEVMQHGIWDYLADSVNAFTQGYNVSLLAYGQSGAGKSYTMGTSNPGEYQDESMIGVLPRAATALFQKLDVSNAGGSSASSSRQSISSLRSPRSYNNHQNLLGDRNWSLKATYVEIYNEQLRDLLVPESTPAGERTNIAIREDTKGNIILTGLRQVDIGSVEDLMNALNFGSSIRQTDATAINAKSSRSHAVFSLNLVQRKSKLQTATGAEKRASMPLEAMSGQDLVITTDSKLHFVDLAGSERLKNTGAHGERAKEGISINAGLASLGKVISQLSSRQSGSHVSYRDSKLTRLLQDSLGGNAITYMIACVTPAEFHLSETLNTVQYAQRARAIQSKPRIQQVDDGDSRALIERLRAEVSFLRDQIRSSHGGDDNPRRGNAAPNERSDRSGEREAELQNQLLDSQENYSALSQRHAKLIAELARAREHEKEQAGQSGANSADDRLNRSNSFAQAVEQVVLEYEKTIQSLGQSLSSTRSTLSNTETSLLEKETKCAYVDTINSQLQARLQKLMDREASTENYLHDLEVKLDGHTSGEEKNATIILELRKEIARVRENDAACEDYISTLEERLAEADQDTELMQREIDRLESVVERQRSLGKLDALLYELDHVDPDKAEGPEPTMMNEANHSRRYTDHSRSQSHVSRRSQLDGPIPEENGEHAHDAGSKNHVLDVADGEVISDVDQDNAARRGVEGEAKELTNRNAIRNAKQSKYVADKREAVTQELLDLRVEHEAAIQDYDQLQAKYEETLRSLSELQDAVDEARHPERPRVRDSAVFASALPKTRPDSFTSDGKSVDLKDEPRSSMSRSLSSELSSAMESPATMDTSAADLTSEADTATTKPAVSSEDLVQRAGNQQLTAEIERLRKLAEEKEVAEKTLAEKYAELESTHNETLDVVEELKTEVSKARAVEATSPRTTTPVIRRKSSQNLLAIDRAHRCFASLRNIASENFENQPEVMQSFELNLNSAMHELHSRSERILELEADIASVKKEMETKMTIISGLTRERSSLKASPMDMSMVANLRDQLERNEKQMSQIREAHESREKELTLQLDELRGSFQTAPATPTTGEVVDADIDDSAKQREQRISELESELSEWEEKHRLVMDAAEKTEADLRANMTKLEARLASSENKVNESMASEKTANGVSVKDTEQRDRKLIDFLRTEIDEYKAIININSTKIAELAREHADAQADVEELRKSHKAAVEELERHRELVASLESQVASHSEAARSHQEALELARDRHAKEMSDLKSHEQTSYEEQAEVLLQEHTDSMHKLEEELSGARDELTKIATQVATGMGVDVTIELLSERIDQLLSSQKTLSEEQQKTEEMKKQVAELTSISENALGDIKAAKSCLAEMLSEGGGAVPTSVVEQLDAVKTKLADLEDRNKKNSRLVEELEEQLQNNFDEAQMTNNRLSTLQTERNVQLEEATAARAKLQSDLDSIQEEYAALQTKYQELSNRGEVKRSNSNSTIRKSASHTTLPSPPPAIPLPPLPNVAARGGSPTNSGVPSSPTPGRPVSKDNVNISQLTEDPEARIRTIEKHLYAERQLTQTLEEALTDLEKQSKKVKADCETWKKRSQELEAELRELKERQAEPPRDNRWSMQAVEEERKKRQAAELARKQLEERMNAINKGKKKKGSLNCF
ncbi:kinesin [Metarhizium album ARSEF 1941]|uniref:Kinesin n=1 Tax=Metarhizium album (strain ARSEF 1941) TaxID=1081103 RepID=A0A0B2WNJ8_METAS|nr:kinesin [Metarhizium album ARSEF 1941]KHN95548.1 kinesin [Metarhizium album ARSEF 1941]